MSKMVVAMSGDEAKLWQSFQKIAKKQAELEGGFKKIGQAGKKAGADVVKVGDRMQKAGRQGDKAFGGDAVSQLKTFFGTFTAGQQTVKLLTKALDAMAAARKKAAEPLKTAAMSIGALAQVTPAAEMPQAVQETRQFYQQGGAGSLAEAYQMMFEIKSAGAEKEKQFIARLYGITDQAGLLKAGGKLRSAFGAKEAGTFNQILSKGLAAAAPISGESASTGGTQVKALFSSLIGHGYADTMKGKTLAEMLQSIRQKQLSGQELQKFLGGSEALAAFEALQPGAYQSRLAEIEQAQAQDLAGKRIAGAESIPAFGALKRRRMAMARREVSELGMGVKNLEADAYRERHIAAMRNRGEDEGQVWLAGEPHSKLRWMAGDETYLSVQQRGLGNTQIGDMPAPNKVIEVVTNLTKILPRLIPVRMATLAGPDQDK